MRKVLSLVLIECRRQGVRHISSFENAAVRRENYESKFLLNTKQIALRRGFSEISEIPCWQCHKNTKRKNQFFCEKCGSLQDPDSNSDYYQLLSLEKGFNVNPTELTTKFRQLQNVLHPDKYSNRSEREQNNSLAWSSLVNKAYKTLSVPIDRGEYLLQRQDIRLPEDNSVLDKEFLMEMMEKNEEVEDATKDNIFELLKTVQNDLETAANELDEHFSQDNFEDAKFVLIRMKYYRSLEKSIKEKAVRMGAVK